MRLRTLCCLIFLASGADVAAEPEFDNPLLRQRADPHAFLHTDGQYYVSATVAEWDRIEIRRTRDLDALDSAETQVIWRKHASGPMSAHIWAPEIHFIDGKWYKVSYYTPTDRKQGSDSAQGNIIPNDKLTPLVFVNDTLQGWGWERWEQVAATINVTVPPRQ